ncbi:MAG: phosphatidate cytidylyltransferase [Bifidobacteriaceae bacterium]|jgi:phosphatidate cytidylyltransferase|nr:phosphatidate cytidylyltransferase [Bifidobacteriaceae bacterium]
MTQQHNNLGINHHDAQETLESINKRTGRNMPQAIATGAVLVILIAGTLLISPHAFAYLLIAFMIMGVWELRVDFATVGVHISPIALWLCSILMLLSSYYAPDHLLALGVSLGASLIIVSLAAAFNPFSGGRVHRAVASKMAGQAQQVVPSSSQATEPGRFADICVSIFSVLYIPLLAAFLVFLLVQPSPQIKVMMAIFIPALGDTGGLVFGAAFGKHKLSPRISPKKSYEGLAGSMLFCTVGSLLFYGFAFQADFLNGGWWKPIVMGIVIAITGTFGDLCASMLKRDMGIKDMGHLLKGHGGILDRVDSILISAPFFFVMFTLFGV